MSPVVVAGVDLGASGGRVIAARVAKDGIELEEVSRFPNEPVLAGGTLHWDILRLYADVEAGLAKAAREFPLASAGIDAWAVDYGLLDEAGALVGNPVHYRDRRTAGITVSVSASDLYATTGIQHLPFNTIYQLAAAAGTPALTAARTLLLIPDLLGYWLTGEKGTEVTNASTTALLDVKSRTWATRLMDRVGIPRHLFPSLRQPGDVIGPVCGTGAGVADGAGAKLIGADGRALPLVAVASHDTASAVAAVPTQTKNFAYISCGTWSLVGLELDQPVLTEASRQANFTNEAGLDGTVRYLRNVSGLWLLQECQRHWGAKAGPLDDLLRQAAQVPAQRFVIDSDDPVFLPPGDMPGRIKEWLASHGRPIPNSPAEFTRCILDSLALAYRKAVSDAQELSGRHADVVHIVGGGSRNELLCQLTADVTGLPVIAGPAEATALGNVLVQARALGAAPPTLRDMRALLLAVGGLRRFDPHIAQLSRSTKGCIVSSVHYSVGNRASEKRVSVSVSIREVAAHAGVSVATVSNVLNRPDIVARATRDRVNASIMELGFVRNESARQLRAGRSRTIGLVVLDVTNPFFTDLARGVEDEANKAGLAVILCNSDDQERKEQRYLELLEEHRVQGVLITPVAGAGAQLARLQRRGTPVVLVDSRSPSRGQCSVAVDDVLGGDLALSHLLDAGHRHIAFISGPRTIRQAADRYEGALRALDRAGLRPEDLRVIDVEALNVAAGQKVGAEIATLPAADRPTAVFCANDLIALGVLQEMTRHKIRVPEDVAIVGYDDIDFAAAAAVPLTSVRQPRQQLGRTAARMLLEEAAAGESHQHQQVIFEPELIVRRSTG